jgi:hypothetical protein
MISVLSQMPEGGSCRKLYEKFFSEIGDEEKTIQKINRILANHLKHMGKKPDFLNGKTWAEKDAFLLKSKALLKKQLQPDAFSKRFGLPLRRFSVTF